MANGADFYPPQLNRGLVRCTQIAALLLVRWLYWVELEVQDTDRQLLTKLKSDRLLLLPNHPTFHDPIVMFTLSAQLRQAFYYLAAYETFDDPSVMFLIAVRFAPLRVLARLQWIKAGLRWCLQKLGIYSIRRGLADRPSIVQTINLLSQPGCHLVIFPEGGCSFQNDTVMPFRPGAVQLAFQAMHRISKTGDPPPDLYVVPVAIKYYYTQDMQPVIQATLSRLEQALNLPLTAATSPYDRLRRIAATILIRIEREYGFDAERHASWNDRIDAIRLHVVHHCEQQLSMPSVTGELIRERVYRLQHAIRTHLEPASDLPLAQIEKSLSRLLNFDAIYDGYVAEDPTPERFLDTLIRLEREVFDIDQPPPKGFRRVKLKLGSPVNLKDYWADYSHDRTAVIHRLTSTFQDTVQTHLHQLSEAVHDPMI